MNSYYVYTHTRNDTNKVFYVGKGKKSRAYATSGRNRYWKNVVTKTSYVVNIICNDMSETDSLELEMLVISEYRRSGIVLTNLTDGGEGVSGMKDTNETRKKKSLKATGRKMSSEAIRKSSEKNKGRVSPRKGVTLSDEQKLKISVANTGNTPSQDARQKMSEVSKGKRKSETHRLNIKRAKQNISDDTRQKMRASARIREEKKKLNRGNNV